MSRQTILLGPGVSGFLIMLVLFSLPWFIFSIFLGILSHLLFFLTIFMILDRFFEVLGGFWEGFWEVFSRIFRIFFENAHLQILCAHAVFRKGRAYKNSLKS